MIELPRGLWKWLSESSRNLGRLATAAERIADELAAIRRESQETDDTKEER